ncbi:MAG: phosphoenolpyruvate carboxykinase (GTP) [Candidatus Cloacimonas sp. 4484_209]|nr:MAG: phosphoenolpyruvate carboxykinase (GTP) [Candidatus Cloacimonas sp. 4484_209]
MNEKIADRLKTRLGEDDYQKLAKIDNSTLHEFILKYIELCNPDKIFVCNDSSEDRAYIREAAIHNGEEMKLAMENHTVHFDGYYDQARDKKRTKFLVSKGMDLGPNLNTIDKQEGENEIHEILKDIMKGHELYIRFFTLGPTNSIFSIPCVQLTDSSYVAHSEDLLYRPGYEEFVRLGNKARFFKFVHSEGELDERKTSKNIGKRRVYIDNEGAVVYCTNTQYGGNTIGLKKLAMRLAIYRASKEGWLTEHMFVMGVHGPNGRVTYFTGAFPSLCGKTSTSMVTGETIVGDDIAYLRKKDGKVYAVNVEKGMFGIIMGVNSKDDPIIWKRLHTPKEIIFSNVLVKKDKTVYWIGKDDEEVPESGVNHSGEWYKGKRDAEGNEITPSHRNARFTISLDTLDNIDPKINDPEGCLLGGIIYGGRDSDTWVPVCQSFDWVHGIINKASSLESETTAATLGKEGVRKFNLMSNLDFISIPLGEYIKNNINFGNNIENPPLIFAVNYFLKDKNGNFLNAKTDKRVWLKWMELRVHNEVDAIKTPIGYIPKYEDLKRLFKEVQNRDYSLEAYNEQFKIRIPELLSKIDRIENVYKTKVPDVPEVLFKKLSEEKERLLEAKEKFGDYITPDKW